MSTSSTDLVIPSKYDIIPIHTSDRATFKNCRRKWNWSSPARNNLTRKVSIFGIYPPFWFGTGIHNAIEKYYDPSYTEDCVVAFESWFEMQVNGGYCTEDELPEFIDREPKLQANGMYWVNGLKDLMPTFDIDVFDEYLATGVGMLNYYKEYAAANDNFTVIAVEQVFSVPVLDENGNALYMPDTRSMPHDWLPDLSLENSYGELMRLEQSLDQSNVLPQDGPVYDVYKQVHARGRIDCIIQDNETGRYGIRDYKTASRIDEDYFRHLDLDEQVTTYSYAAEVMAHMYDLPYKQIDFLDYQALLKAYPKPPTKLKNGTLSISRSTESTTAEMFAEAIDILNQRALFNADDKMQSYYTWLIETENKRFINTYRVRRNAHQKAQCGRRLYFEALDMLDANVRIYPNPTKDYSCLNCWFRTPCTMVEDGSDYNSLLEDGFVLNHDR